MIDLGYVLFVGKREYRGVKREQADSILCLTCGSVSYNKHDIREAYCGACDKFLINRCVRVPHRLIVEGE